MKKIQLLIAGIILLGGIGVLSYLLFDDSILGPKTQISEQQEFPRNIGKEDFKNNQLLQPFSGSHNNSRQITQQRFGTLQDIAIRKNNNLHIMEERLDNIIHLADKVGYDSSKLRFYRQEIQKHKKEYHNLRPDGSIRLEDFSNQRTGRLERNKEMRSIGSGIHKEFANLQKYLNDNFIE